MCIPPHWEQPARRDRAARADRDGRDRRGRRGLRGGAGDARRRVATSTSRRCAPGRRRPRRAPAPSSCTAAGRTPATCSSTSSGRSACPTWPTSSRPPRAGRWYPDRFDAPRAANEPWLAEALAACGAALDGLAAAGVPPQRIVLAGFSQGACLAADLLARRPGACGGRRAAHGRADRPRRRRHGGPAAGRAPALHAHQPPRRLGGARARRGDGGGVRGGRRAGRAAGHGGPRAPHRPGRRWPACAGSSSRRPPSASRGGASSSSSGRPFAWSARNESFDVFSSSRRTR